MCQKGLGMENRQNTHNDCKVAFHLNTTLPGQAEFDLNDLKVVIKRYWNVDFRFEAEGMPCVLKGRSNVNIIEACTPRYIVRITPGSMPQDRLVFSHELQSLLRSAGYDRVPLCLKLLVPFSSDGDEWILPWAGCYVSLFQFQEGATLQLWETPARRLLNQIVRNYRDLNEWLDHTVVPCETLDFNGCLKETLKLVSEQTEWMGGFEVSEDLMAHFPQFVKNGERLMRQVDEMGPLHRQLVHGDIHQENMLFHSDALTLFGKEIFRFDRFVSFLDFEEVSIGYLEVDVIFSALRLCKREKSNPHLTINERDLTYFLCRYDKRIYDLYCENIPFWRAFFAFQQSLLYMRHAYYGEWQLTRVNGFMQCFNEVVNYEE